MNSPRGSQALILGVIAVLILTALVVIASRAGQPGVTPSSTSSLSSVSTTFAAEVTVKLNIDLALLGYVDNGNGTFTVDYEYTITNPYNQPASALAATSQFTQTGNPGLSVQIVNFSSSDFNLNGGFNGLSNQNLLAPGTTIPANSSGKIRLRVIVAFGPGQSPIKNEAYVSGRIQTSSSTPTSGTTSSSASNTGTPTTPPTTPSSTSSATSTPTEDSDEVIFNPDIGTLPPIRPQPGSK